MTHCHTLLKTLRQLGYRLTPQREMIVEAVAHAEGHVTAEEVFDLVKERTSTINLATIYRTLDLLVEKGLASRADLWDGRVVYATVNHGPHIHLVCRQCGDVFNAEYTLVAPLGVALKEKYAFKADLQHLSISGVCADCAGKISE